MNTYLEDEQQLDEVYWYLNELYTKAVATSSGLRKLKVIDRVSFILDVLLPEVSNYILMVNMHNMSSNAYILELQYCSSYAGHHLCHSWSGQNLTTEGRGEVSERTIYQYQVGVSNIEKLYCIP